ncbi:Gfo/Idh/MocA family protein [Sinomonas albida]|uniref:Gfo/Idh/MocA family protein n=1 Tax=Sinomonas albida TaxID=369942 RepID=UPI0010A807B9|nr:Gfo/Idh/MocA family oxidoreductase [Sinomonas albida]
MSRKVRLGLAGFGHQGSGYAARIAEGKVPNLELVAVMDIDPERRALAAERHPDATVFDNYTAMLESGEIEAVIVTAPHYFHPPMGIEALEHGLHVLVDKPAGVYTKQVLELNAVAASKPELTFAIMFNQRTSPLYSKIKEILDAGQLGAIRRTNWLNTNWYRPQAYYNQSDWRATWGGEGGGILVNQSPHNLDMWQWLCGVPKSVFAKATFGFRRDIEVEDEVLVVIDYGNGAYGTYSAGTHELVGTDRLEITGDRGKIVVTDAKTLDVTLYKRSEQEINASIGPGEIWKMTSGEFDPEEYFTHEVLEFDNAWSGQHERVLQNFGANILDGTPLIAPGSDGVMGVRLANAIHLSAWTGKEVPIDFDDDEFLAELNKKIAEEGKFPQRG